MGIDFREVRIDCQDAKALISQLDRELQCEYAPEHMHTVDFESFLASAGVFVIGYAEEEPVACGALRPLSDTQVELKRMFVVAPYRGRGISRQLLSCLEQKARELDYQQLVLETGDEQHAAIGLYTTAGFSRTAAFGEYVESPRSVCFAKSLK